jgi:hypothetical protein
MEDGAAGQAEVAIKFAQPKIVTGNYGESA